MVIHVPWFLSSSNRINKVLNFVNEATSMAAPWITIKFLISSNTLCSCLHTNKLTWRIRDQFLPWINSISFWASRNANFLRSSTNSVFGEFFTSWEKHDDRQKCLISPYRFRLSNEKKSCGILFNRKSYTDDTIPSCESLERFRWYVAGMLLVSRPLGVSTIL